MLASDVAHLFQSYENFLKWNERLYLELWKANLEKRGFDPSASWYGGQITFIDNYLRPLAERLSLCNVFGDNGTLFGHNLSDIRRRWTIEGEKFCKDMMRKCAKSQGGGVKGSKVTGRVVSVNG